MSNSCPGFSKFSAIISLNTLSAPVSLLFPSEIPGTLRLIFVMESNISGRLSSFFLMLVFFFSSNYVISQFLFSKSFILPSIWSALLQMFSVASYNSAPSFCLVLFYNFNLFDEELILYMYFIPDFIELSF